MKRILFSICPCLLTIVAASVVLCGCSCERSAQKKELPPQELKEQTMNQTSVLIDNRTSDEYAAGHVKGAILMPYDAIGSMITEQVPDKATPLLLYCRSGRRADSARKTLESMGYSNVTNLGSMENAAAKTAQPVVTK